jgi:hypothetical protein
MNIFVYLGGAAVGSIGCGVLSLVILTGLVGVQRKQFRQQFGIPGDELEDFFCSCCCHCCVLAQMDRHLALSANHGCNFQDPGPAMDIPPLAEPSFVIQHQPQVVATAVPVVAAPVVATAVPTQGKAQTRENTV